MAKQKQDTRPIERYAHAQATRSNNPPAGLVNTGNDPDVLPARYAYDPHIDPQLHWAGKAEHTSFEVPTVSLHVHERIDPQRIIHELQRTPEPDAQPSLLGVWEQSKVCISQNPSNRTLVS
jgi:adenine-specific DNA-methyltransferase